MIGMNMVVEGLALAAFHNMRKQATCPLLRSLTEYVLRDESRHVAFGNVYLAQTIADMHPDDREDVAQFAFEAVKAMADATGGVDGKQPAEARPRLPDSCSSTRASRSRTSSQASWRRGGRASQPKLPPGHIHSLRDLMMPALVRVGAVTDAHARALRRRGHPGVGRRPHARSRSRTRKTGDITIPADYRRD